MCGGPWGGARTPTLMYPDGLDGLEVMYRRILVPIDGSAVADAAFDHALSIADAVGASVDVLYVADTAQDSVTVVGNDVVDALEQEGEDVVTSAADRARTQDIEVTTEVLQGDPAETILDYVETRDADVIVMGTQGRTGLTRALLGSVAEKVIRNATVPVLTVGPDAVAAD